MTEQNPPSVISTGCYTAAQDRNLYSDLICAEGVVGRDALKVSVSGGVQIQVAAGAAWIDGTVVEGQGVYRVFNDAPVNLALSAADPTDARIDLIIARVYDSAYEGSSDEWRLEVVQGVPAPSPLEPALPNSSLPLARINIPAGAGEVTDADVIDLRVNYQTCSTGSGAPLATQAFTSNGTFDPTAYPTTATVFVEVFGGGGGGGGAGTTDNDTAAAGSGGGGGGYGSGWVPVSDMGGAPVTVKVGAGGAGSPSGSGTAKAGAGSSFGGFVIAGGGGPGVSQVANTSVQSQSSGGVQGAGGTGTHVLGSITGGRGFNAGVSGSQNFVTQMGFGGDGARGGGGGKLGGGDGNSAGGIGYEPGGGGSGAFNRHNQSAQPGGDGARGAVYVTVYS